jgi:radical SAM superfamily enzyme YgiQ (UPF0313 family)
VVLLISTYDLGRQPFGLASPAAWLRRAGIETATRDLSRDRLNDEDIATATIVAFYLPMHTATRLALPTIDRIRAQRPDVTLCAYGLYAPLNESLLRDRGVSVILGPEAEPDLVRLATDLQLSTSPDLQIPRSPSPLQISNSPNHHVQRFQFIPPDRTDLPALARYATLQLPDGTRRVTGATEATRGCKHRCRHCPIVPVYDGQFRVVSLEVVLADIDQQVAAGAGHITFGDPDFFNGPTHARRIVEALHARHPDLSYDVTIKVEHLLKHRDLLQVLAATGCLFITSAVEAIDDDILARLEKNHTRADFESAVTLTRQAGLTLAPTFVAFTPWTTMNGYRELLEAVEELDLVENVSPVQWGLRLLITHGSRLLELDDIRARVDRFDAKTLTYPWKHDDPRVDELQAAIARTVGVKLTQPRAEVFRLVKQMSGLEKARLKGDVPVSRAAIPYLNEPWYC